MKQYNAFTTGALAVGYLNDKEKMALCAMAALRNPYGRDEVIPGELTCYIDTSTFACIKNLVNHGLINKTQKPSYLLTEAGEIALYIMMQDGLVAGHDNEEVKKLVTTPSTPETKPAWDAVLNSERKPWLLSNAPADKSTALRDVCFRLFKIQKKAEKTLAAAGVVLFQPLPPFDVTKQQVLAAAAEAQEAQRRDSVFLSHIQSRVPTCTPELLDTMVHEGLLTGLHAMEDKSFIEVPPNSAEYRRLKELGFIYGGSANEEPVSYYMITERGQQYLKISVTAAPAASVATPDSPEGSGVAITSPAGQAATKVNRVPLANLLQPFTFEGPAGARQCERTFQLARHDVSAKEQCAMFSDLLAPLGVTLVYSQPPVLNITSGAKDITLQATKRGNVSETGNYSYNCTLNMRPEHFFKLCHHWKFDPTKAPPDLQTAWQQFKRDFVISGAVQEGGTSRFGQQR